MQLKSHIEGIVLRISPSSVCFLLVSPAGSNQWLAAESSSSSSRVSMLGPSSFKVKMWMDRKHFSKSRGWVREKVNEWSDNKLKQTKYLLSKWGKKDVLPCLQDQPVQLTPHVFAGILHQTQSICNFQTPCCGDLAKPERGSSHQTAWLCWNTNKEENHKKCPKGCRCKHMLSWQQNYFPPVMADTLQYQNLHV